MCRDTWLANLEEISRSQTYALPHQQYLDIQIDRLLGDVEVSTLRLFHDWSSDDDSEQHPVGWDAITWDEQLAAQEFIQGPPVFDETGVPMWTFY